MITMFCTFLVSWSKALRCVEFFYVAHGLHTEINRRTEVAPRKVEFLTLVENNDMEFRDE